MAFDTTRGVGVLVSGTFGPVYAPRGDTWEWDGTRWDWESSQVPPGARLAASLVFDKERDQSLLFGGWWTDCPNCGIFSAQSWHWNGAIWTLHPNPGPRQRESHAMVYDAARKVVVLFGGLLENEVGVWLGDDTWEWNGEWSQRSVVGPSPRRAHAMAYDKNRSVVVLFGGYGVDDLPFSGTWEYDGATWIPVASAGPDPRARHTMVFDELRGTVILFGGGVINAQQNIAFNDTWEWDGSTWRELCLSTSPSPRYGHGMVYDSARHEILLYGGRDAKNLVNDETWTLRLPIPCYSDCDTQTGPGILDIFDFLCFGNAFSAGCP